MLPGHCITSTALAVTRSCWRNQVSNFHLTAIVASKKAGRHKATKDRSKALTYEESNKPDMIGVRKDFNSHNTVTLRAGIRKAETIHEDLLIRKFIHGTWPKLLASDVIIKRKANQILLSYMVIRMLAPRKIYFLIGYTEEILSCMLKCIVKVELQTIDSPEDMTFRYI